MAEVEGRKREHEFHAGRYWDVLTFAISRPTWERYRAEHADRRRGAKESVESIFSERTELDLSEIAPELGLVELGLDSLDLAELAEALRSMADHEVPLELIESLRTVGDVQHYVAACRRPPRPSS